MRPPVDYIERTREQYAGLGYPPYSWVHSDTPPSFTPISKPLSQSKLGLIGSGGVYLAGQVAFHFKDDFSYREIDTHLPAAQRRVTHFAYDLTDARQDTNAVLPIDPLHRAVQYGWVGELSRTAYAFMGGIYSSRKVRDILAPALVERLQKDEVDVALLVPV